MAERTLRGARLGGQSFEDERGIEFAARQRVVYVCPQGHTFDIPMSAEADIPPLKEKGVAEIFTPGATTQSIVDWVRANVRQPAGA